MVPLESFVMILQIRRVLEMKTMASYRRKGLTEVIFCNRTKTSVAAAKISGDHNQCYMNILKVENAHDSLPIPERIIRTELSGDPVSNSKTKIANFNF